MAALALGPALHPERNFLPLVLAWQSPRRRRGRQRRPEHRAGHGSTKATMAMQMSRKTALCRNGASCTQWSKALSCMPRSPSSVSAGGAVPSSRTGGRPWPRGHRVASRPSRFLGSPPALLEFGGGRRQVSNLPLGPRWPTHHPRCFWPAAIRTAAFGLPRLPHDLLGRWDRAASGHFSLAPLQCFLHRFHGGIRSKATANTGLKAKSGGPFKPRFSIPVDNLG